MIDCMSRQLQSIRIVWLALVASLLVYGAIPFVLPLPGEPAAVLVPLVAALVFVALATALATMVLRRVAITGPLASGALDPATKTGAGRVLAISVVLWALCESIGVYGLVLFFLYRELALFYPFLLVAMALMLFHAPRALASQSSASDLARPDVKIG